MDIKQAPKTDGQPPNTNRNRHPSSVHENLATKHANTVPRWKEVDNSSALKNLSLDDTATKHSNNSQAHPSGFTNPSQGRQVRTQGRGRGYSRLNHASEPSVGQQHATRRGPKVQNRTQLYSQSPNHLITKQIGDGSQASSSPPGGYASPQSFENGEQSQSESSKAKTDVVGKAAGAVQGGAIGPFMYNGAQIIGANMGVSHGDQTFPTFLPGTSLFFNSTLYCALLVFI